MNRSILILSLSLSFFINNCYAKSESPRYISFVTAKPAVVNVMTFNIRANNIMDFGTWSSRKPLVIDVIADHAPDVFGLQEPLHGQIEQVQQAFPQYSSYFAGGADGKDRGESCPVFYRKDRFVLMDEGTFWFSNQPDKPGSKGWGEPVPRFCSWVLLGEKGTNNTFYIYNTHLACLSQNSREKSVRLLEKEIAARKTQAPFIILGDFNMRLINPAMEFLLVSSPENRYPVTDAWLSVHPDQPDTSTCNFGAMAKGPQIDHIQLGRGATTLSAAIDDRKINGHYPSDHFPVIAKVMLPQQPALRPVAASRPVRAASAPY